ncbi:MAG: hypothetical protein QGG40_11530, partial [Myxococcota bacterium]|nr:hypothetical protein [Myxococcota bacterium]
NDDCDDSDAESFPGAPGIREDCFSVNDAWVYGGGGCVQSGPTGRTSPVGGLGILVLLLATSARRRRESP